MGKLRIKIGAGTFLLGALMLASGGALATGTLLSTGDMTTERAYQHAAVLDNGKVLEVAGIQDFGVLLSTAELYDPVSGIFSATGSLATGRGLPNVVKLDNGEVLVAGGRGGNRGGSVFQSTELYDPVTGTFSSGPDMLEPRYVAVGIKLHDGRVLFAGGFNFGAGTLDSAEIYDPSTNSFSATGDMKLAVTAQGNAIVLNDGRVLIVGGASDTGAVSRAQIYDPASGTFSYAGSLPEPRADPSVVLLNDGRVLVVGGDDSNGNYPATAHIWDPATESFAATGDLNHPRGGQTAALLPNGNVLVVGGLRLGSFGDPNVAQAEIYDLASGTFLDAGSLLFGSAQPETTVLNDGRVLIAGGFVGAEGVPTKHASLFTPDRVDEIFADGFELRPGAPGISRYDDLVEGTMGSEFDYQGIHYHDANGIAGVFPDGSTFAADELGDEFLIEDASYLFRDHPDAGSAPNLLTFGAAWITGPNFSIGALSQASMDLPQPAKSASVKLVFYENGPWGGIQIHLDALSRGAAVAFDSITIRDEGGRDNVATATLQVDARQFDELHLYATYDRQPTAPRVMIDDLTITPANSGGH